MTAPIQERVERLRSEAAYRNYERVRDEVLAMQAAEATLSTTTPSAYWREELAGFEYMLDASPLIVEKLRHHTFHVTGLRVYEYRTGKTRQHEALARKLAALRSVGDDALLVPEARELGGFGYEIDGRLFNVDTLKFFEALIALERAEELEGFRRRPSSVAVEIGSGWGGFAYQFKSLFPATRYVLVDLPELFLFSAVYLMTLFPDATVAFGRDALRGDADFSFVPHFLLEELALERIDLVANMVSFQEMTSDQVRRYAHWAHGAGARALYSLNRDRSLYNEELTGVRGLLAERFWLEEPFVLPHAYNELPGPKDKRRAPRPGVDEPVAEAKDRYRHVVGRPRLLLNAP